MARKSRKIQQLEQSEITTNMRVFTEYNVAIYTRLSLENNNLDNRNSIEAQQEMLLSYIDGQKDMKLYASYCDNGFTGTNFERDEFQHMMNDIKDEKVNCIVVKDLSRFARNYIEAGNYIQKIFPFMGVRFISVNDGYDSNKNDVSDIMVTMRNIINDAYTKDISKKIKTTFKTKQNNGDFIGWSAPYGYAKSSENHNRLEIDLTTAPIAKQIFEWKTQGRGFIAIAKRLNEMDILSPRMKNIADGRYKNNPTDGRLWSEASISTIIKNPVYAGHMAQCKYARLTVNGKQKMLDKSDWIIVRNTHEAIVSDELWEKAQPTIRNIPKNSRVKNGDKKESILKGMLVCADCNKVMQHRAYKNTSTEYYICTMHIVNPNCNTKSVRMDDLLSIIFEVIKKEVRIAADINKILLKLSKSKNHLDALSMLQQKIKDINRQIKRTSTLKDGLFEAYSNDVISENEFKSMKCEYSVNEECLRNDLLILEQEFLKRKTVYSSENERIFIFLKYRSKKCLTREMLLDLVEKIIVYDSKSIEIVWRFHDEYKAICDYAKGGVI